MSKGQNFSTLEENDSWLVSGVAENKGVDTWELQSSHPSKFVHRVDTAILKRRRMIQIAQRSAEVACLGDREADLWPSCFLPASQLLVPDSCEAQGTLLPWVL